MRGQVKDPFGTEAPDEGAEIGVLERDGMEPNVRPDAMEPPRRRPGLHEEMHAMPVGEQTPNEIRADEPGPSGDENPPSHER